MVTDSLGAAGRFPGSSRLSMLIFLLAGLAARPGYSRPSGATCLDFRGLSGGTSDPEWPRPVSCCPQTAAGPSQWSPRRQPTALARSGVGTSAETGQLYPGRWDGAQGLCQRTPRRWKGLPGSWAVTQARGFQQFCRAHCFGLVTHCPSPSHNPSPHCSCVLWSWWGDWSK